MNKELNLHIANLEFHIQDAVRILDKSLRTGGEIQNIDWLKDASQRLDMMLLKNTETH
jgi:hypothetical protein